MSFSAAGPSRDERGEPGNKHEGLATCVRQRFDFGDRAPEDSRGDELLEHPVVFVPVFEGAPIIPSSFFFLYLKPGAPPPSKATFVLFGLVGGAIVGAVVYEYQFELGWSAFPILLVAVFLINVISGLPYAVSLSIDTPLPRVRKTVSEAGNKGDPSTANVGS